jgi:hypothetical protein
MGFGSAIAVNRLKPFKHLRQQTRHCSLDGSRHIFGGFSVKTRCRSYGANRNLGIDRL